ncbi:MAG: desulfoferrodoxin [Candidatus Aenigmarchaeota archaeon]|nr:desulfoferrodoxin [Candidatus Aenigmarchaeota archaeon]
MTELLGIYKCNICGNMVQVIHKGPAQLVCCAQPMELLEEKTEDKGLEKHVPVVEKTDKGFKVKVGSTPHPMEEEHYIEWVEVLVDGNSCRKFLKPGQKPEVEFEISPENIEVREYCNIHGLWKS